MVKCLLILLCVIASVISSPAINLIKCNHDDDKCVTEAVKAAYAAVIKENQDIGAESMDPMFQEYIEGNLSILKYKLLNTTITGYKSCEIQNTKFDANKLALRMELKCPSFFMTGTYEIDGRLIILPVQGKGDYKLDTKTYNLNIDAELKTAPGKDGKNYMTIKQFKLEPEALDGVSFDFRNLFNGEKDLADAVHKFANENWKEVASEFQSPIFIETVKKIVKNANKYLKTIPIDTYLKQ